MRILSRGAAAAAFIMLIASCSSLLKKGGDDGGGAEASTAEIADTGTAPAPAALALNEGDVARFPDEVKLANVSATFQRSYNVRESPPAGTLVTGLGKGTVVQQIAQRGNFFLIIFDHRTSPGAKQMGWVHKDAFSASVPDAGPLVCTNGEVALWSDSPFCGKVCGGDADCPAGFACKGQANKLLANGKAGDGVQVCTTFVPHDAGAPPPPPPPPADAGKLVPPPGDAGKLLIVDAAPPPPPPPSGADVVAKVGGACPAGYVAVGKTNKCHKPCPTNPPPCAAKNFCVKCDADQKRVCVENRDSCK